MIHALPDPKYFMKNHRDNFSGQLGFAIAFNRRTDVKEERYGVLILSDLLATCWILDEQVF